MQFKLALWHWQRLVEHLPLGHPHFTSCSIASGASGRFVMTGTHSSWSICHPYCCGDDTTRFVSLSFLFVIPLGNFVNVLCHCVFPDTCFPMPPPVASWSSCVTGVISTELSNVCCVGYVVIPWSLASLPSNPGGCFELKR